MRHLFRNIILVLLVSFGSLFASIAETATKFNTTIEEIALYNSETSSWTVIANSPKTFDIASADAGAAVGNMAGSIGDIPNGTYTKIRIKIGGSFSWSSASVASGSNTLDFRSGGNVGTSYIEYTNQTTQSTYANGSSGFVTVYDTSSLIFPIPEGVQTSFRIDFDVQNIVIDNLRIGFPRVRIYINDVELMVYT